MLFADKLTVKTEIKLSRSIPAAIGRHSRLHNIFPTLLIHVCIVRTSYSIEHIMCVVGLERKTVSVVIASILDTVAQTSRFADNRNCTVTQRYHLRKSA